MTVALSKNARAEHCRLGERAAGGTPGGMSILATLQGPTVALTPRLGIAKPANPLLTRPVPQSRWQLLTLTQLPASAVPHVDPRNAPTGSRPSGCAPRRASCTGPTCGDSSPRSARPCTEKRCTRPSQGWMNSRLGVVCIDSGFGSGAVGGGGQSLLLAWLGGVTASCLTCVP